MARRKKKRIVDKKWISVYFDNCPKCLAVVEINSFSKKDDVFFNLDEVRCSAQCGATGVFKIEPGQFIGMIDWQQ